ncbi:MAG: cell division protein FtsZ [Rickettsiaceae bacterium]|nr:MAG: cell division protein FtsZ [Rickettsiaceae bacterium]
MSINFKAPEKVILKPVITVFGVGGAGGNAVNNMLTAKLEGANFIVANTDAQALEHSLCDSKIQLGATLTKGLGAGASAEVGRLAAEESSDEIKGCLEGSNMVFVTAGMGGGTGTGSSPIVARIAKDLGILTVGVVTMPFQFEGKLRMKTAEEGLKELHKFVDTLIVIPNQNLFSVANEDTSFEDAFKIADNVLHAGVRGVTDLMTMPGLINLDFADIRSVMSEMGKAMMGTGQASGPDRAINAAEDAISNPLLDQNTMKGAKGVLINITGGKDMTLYEVDAAANRIRREVEDSDANIIFGSTCNPELEGTIRVSVVATGIDAKSPAPKLTIDELESTIKKKLEDISVIKTEDENKETQTSVENLAMSEDLNSYTEPTIAVANREQAQDRLKHREQNYNYNNSMANFNHPPVTHRELPKPSLFSRMWNSLKPNEKHQNVANNFPEYPRNPEISQPSNESEIHEIPAYLRKPKQ